jgi:hypothetical protein
LSTLSVQEGGDQKKEKKRKKRKSVLSQLTRLVSNDNLATKRNSGKENTSQIQK